MCLVLVRKLGPALDAEVLYRPSRDSEPRVPRHLLLNKGQEEVEEFSAAGLFPTHAHADSAEPEGGCRFPRRGGRAQV